MEFDNFDDIMSWCAHKNLNVTTGRRYIVDPYAPSAWLYMVRIECDVINLAYAYNDWTGFGATLFEALREAATNAHTSHRLREISDMENQESEEA